VVIAGLSRPNFLAVSLPHIGVDAVLVILEEELSDPTEMRLLPRSNHTKAETRVWPLHGHLHR
jgi:hypothetical protein